jgi:hypothetical protein
MHVRKSTAPQPSSAIPPAAAHGIAHHAAALLLLNCFPYTLWVWQPERRRCAWIPGIGSSPAHSRRASIAPHNYCYCFFHEGPRGTGQHQVNYPPWRMHHCGRVVRITVVLNLPWQDLCSFPVTKCVLLRCFRKFILMRSVIRTPACMHACIVTLLM